MTGPTGTRVPFHRIAGDAVRTLRSRPGRTVGLGLAIALGVATAIGILSISNAANAHTRNRLDGHRPEIVRIRPTEPAQALTTDLPDDALTRAQADNRVISAASAQTLPEATVTARPNGDPSPAAVIATSGDLESATRAIDEGRTFTTDESETSARVAVVGARIAATIGLGPLDTDPTIWIDGIPFTVIGIAEASEHLGSVTEAILLPRSTAIAYLGDTHGTVDTTIYARTSRGAAGDTAADMPLRISPERPERWLTEVPSERLDLATAISGDLRTLTLAMAGVVLFVGVVAIANAMTRSVYERIPEIGLRRTLGAHRPQILLLLLTEAALIGVTAGAIGTVLGTVTAIVIATHNHWPIAVSHIGIALAIPMALAAGVIGGAVPSAAATRITPGQALRRE